MDWKLIFQLSMFGLAIGIATVYVIPSSIEPIFWLIIFVICAVIIAKRRVGKPFLHGLLVSLVNSVWITAAHVLLFDSRQPRTRGSDDAGQPCPTATDDAADGPDHRITFWSRPRTVRSGGQQGRQTSSYTPSLSHSSTGSTKPIILNGR